MNGLKTKIIKALIPYQYPQVIFGKEIFNLVKHSGPANPAILDCPCGNGELSFHLSRLKNASVTAVDIDEESISSCKRNYSGKNIHFQTSDIFAFLSKKQNFDVICLVNSLFLIPDHALLLSLIKDNLKDHNSRLFIIIPNTEASNYKNFIKDNPFINKYETKRDDLKYKLQESGLKINLIKEIVYLNYYGRPELKYFSVFAPVYLWFRNYIASFKKNNQGNYIIFSCSRAIN